VQKAKRRSFRSLKTFYQKSEILFEILKKAVWLIFWLSFPQVCLASNEPIVFIPNFADAVEAVRIIAISKKIPPERRVSFISKFFLGRKYHPETKTRIKKQSMAPKTKTEATNLKPLPVETLKTSLKFLDCMTYVEHVLALASADRPDYAGSFLPRLVDIMFEANGAPLMCHLRLHFTSHWAEVNERKGYLTDVARGHPLAVSRTVLLNKVGSNRTFFVEDRFMISTSPQVYYYFPLKAVFSGKVPLLSGDILALACEKEGLDVVHMGFFIEQGGKKLIRHASSKLNKVVEEDLFSYLQNRKDVVGLMVLRPKLKAPLPCGYRFVSRESYTKTN